MAVYGPINRHYGPVETLDSRLKMSEMKEAEKAAAQEARAALVERLRHAKAIDLHSVERGKYFRLVAEILADGENMSDVLLKRGLAHCYDGGKRERTFCAGMVGE